MLISLRKGAGTWIARIFIGLLVLSFAVWGIADFLGARGTTAVASIEGREIDAASLENEFQRELYRLQQRFGSSFDRQQARALGLDRQVLRQMITRMMFDEKASELGLYTPDSEVAKVIREDPVFADPFGSFDRARFEQALRNNGYTERDFIARTREEMTRRQLIAGLTSATVPPRHMLKAIYQHQNEQRKVSLIEIPQSAVTQPKPFAAAELRAFYDDNPGLFTAPEYRMVTYVSMQPEALAEEIALDEAELQEEYENRLAEFTTIGTRDIAQILFTDQSQAEAAYARLQEGADFATVARETTGLSADEITLTDITRNELHPDIAAAVFALEKGAISKPLQSPLGWQIVRIDDKRPERVQPFSEVRAEIGRDLALQRAEDALFDISNRFEDARASGETLEEAARIIGLTAKKIPAIDRSGNGPDGTAIPDLPTEAEFLSDIFDSAPGEENDLRETRAGGYFVVRVDDVTPSALRPFDSVVEEVRSALRARATAQALEQLADDIRAQAQSGVSLAEIAETRGLSLTERPAFGRTFRDDLLSPATVGEVFATQPKKVIAAPAPKGGFIVARLDEILVPAFPADDSQTAQIRTALENQMSDDILAQYQTVLEQHYELQINQNQLASLFPDQ